MISVVIPVGKNEPQIGKRIEEIKSTIGDVEYEIIIVTIDKTVCTDSPKVQICLHSPTNCAEARNYGEKMSKGDILVFSDAHTEYTHTESGDDSWGKLLEDTFEQREDIGVATFPRYTLTGDINNMKRDINAIAKGLTFNLDTNLLDVRYVAPLKDGTIPFIWGDFHVIRRSVFEEVGGYVTEGEGHMEDRIMCCTCTLFGYHNISIEGKLLGAYIRPPGSPRSFPHWYWGNMGFHALHYTDERLERAKEFWVTSEHHKEEFDIVFNRWRHLREYYLERRTYDDAWYFNEFLKKFE